MKDHRFNFLLILFLIFSSHLLATPFHHDNSKMNIRIPKKWTLKETGSSRSFDLVNENVPATINLRKIVFPEFKMVDGVLEKSITINGLQFRQMTSRYDGWINNKERMGTIEESINANVSENYVAVYTKNKLNDQLKVEKRMAGEYYYLTRNIGYILSIQTEQKNWPKIKNDARKVVDSFWVGEGDRPKRVALKKPQEKVRLTWPINAGTAQQQYLIPSTINLAKAWQEDWQFEQELSTENSQVNPPILSEKHLFYQSQNRLYALNLGSGQALWTYPFENLVDNASLFAKGLYLFFTRHDTGLTLHAMIPESGQSLYTQAIKGSQFSAPTLNKDQLIMVVDGDLSAFHIDNGKPAWQRNTSLSHDFTPSISGTDLVAITQTNDLLVITLKNGREKWKQPLPFTPLYSPLISDETVVLCGRIEKEEGFLSQVLGISLAKPERQWTLDDMAVATFSAAPIANETQTILSFLNGNNENQKSYTLLSLESKNGRPLWKEKLSLPNNSPFPQPLILQQMALVTRAIKTGYSLQGHDLGTGGPLLQHSTIKINEIIDGFLVNHERLFFWQISPDSFKLLSYK